MQLTNSLPEPLGAGVGVALGASTWVGVEVGVGETVMSDAGTGNGSRVTSGMEPSSAPVFSWESEPSVPASSTFLSGALSIVSPVFSASEGGTHHKRREKGRLAPTPKYKFFSLFQP